MCVCVCLCVRVCVCVCYYKNLVFHTILRAPTYPVNHPAIDPYTHQQARVANSQNIRFSFNIQPNYAEQPSLNATIPLHNHSLMQPATKITFH